MTAGSWRVPPADKKVILPPPYNLKIVSNSSTCRLANISSVI